MDLDLNAEYYDEDHLDQTQNLEDSEERIIKL